MHYFEPLVNELLQLWAGQIFITPSFPLGRIYRGALILLSSDAPATRKISGFAGYNSKHGCYKCNHIFNTKKMSKSNVSRVDFSDFIS